MLMIIRRFCALLAASACLACPAANAQQTAVGGAKAEKSRQLNLEVKPWQGDFDGMLERRLIRFLAPYSRSLFYNDKGRERGLTAELARDFERYVNQKYAKELGKRPVTVLIFATTRDKLLPNLVSGLGDIAAGNLTITPERLKTADFAADPDRIVRELVITGPKSPEVATLDDLAGKTVHVRPTSSYHESLVALNEKFKGARKTPVKIVPLPDALEDEDVLEMLNAGLIELTVVDDWVSKMWGQVLPKVKPRSDLVLRDGGHTGWAIRKGSPKLEEALADFYRSTIKKQGGGEARVAQLSKRAKQISNNTDSAEWKRFEDTLALFRRYGEKYGFDPLMLAAQGYQESQLNQNA